MIALLFTLLIIGSLIHTYFFWRTADQRCFISSILCVAFLALSLVVGWTKKVTYTTYSVAQTSSAIMIETDNPRYIFKSEKECDIRSWTAGNTGYVVEYLNAWGSVVPKLIEFKK